MQKLKYKINTPSVSALEKKYVNDALNKGWLSSGGEHTRIFEEKVSKFVGRKFCIAVQSGTAGIHAALKAAGVKTGDKVITPNYTCSSSISCISQLNAIPVIVEIEDETLGLDYDLFVKAVTIHKPKVAQIVHVYGHPCRDTLKIINFCKKNNIVVIEDASEALGAKIMNKKCGSLGDISVISTRSEKMIGCGEGGLILTNNKILYEKATIYCNRHAPFRKKSDPYWKKYEVTGEGYNYLMPHLSGAFARGQIERFQKDLLPKKKMVGNLYSKHFKETPNYKLTQKRLKKTSPVFWLNSLYFKSLSVNNVKKLGLFLQSKGIEVRPGFWPLSLMKCFNPKYVGIKKISEDIKDKIIILPSSIDLKNKDIIFFKKQIDFFIKNK
jgi:perosamine synthetase